MPVSGYRNRPVIAELFVQTFDHVANQEGYIGTKLMPIVTLDEQSGEYFKVTAEHLLKKRPELRMNEEGNFPEVSYSWTYGTYSTRDRGVEFRLTDRLKGIYKNQFELEMYGAEMLNAMLLEEHEEEVIALVNAETPTAASAAWTTNSTDIIGDVQAAQLRLRNKLMPIDKEKLKLVVDWTVWREMRQNTGILDTFGSSERTDVREATKARIADILEVGEIVVADARKNTIPEGGTASYSSLWTSTKAALVVTGDSGGMPTRKNVRWGNTILWSEAGGAPPRFDRYTKENKTADVMRQRIDRAQHIVASGGIEVISSVA